MRICTYFRVLLSVVYRYAVLVRGSLTDVCFVAPAQLQSTLMYTTGNILASRVGEAWEAGALSVRSSSPRLCRVHSAAEERWAPPLDRWKLQPRRGRLKGQVQRQRPSTLPSVQAPVPSMGMGFDAS